MSTDTQFTGFTRDVLGALLVPGVVERWAAVQERLHPQLLALAEHLRIEAARRFPRAWPIYEITFKNLRYVNRGSGERAPIDEYHFAVDRPPRGCGMYVAVSAEERLILVTLQVARPRKHDLRHVWEQGRAIWQPLVERVDDVRFADERRKTNQRPKAKEEPIRVQETWLDRYLNLRGSSPLLAGFAYRWDDERVAQPEFAKQLVADVLDLFGLNEAIMEQAEVLEPYGAALLRDQRATYAQAQLPPIETIVERIRSRGFTLAEQLVRA